MQRDPDTLGFIDIGEHLPARSPDDPTRLDCSHDHAIWPCRTVLEFIAKLDVGISDQEPKKLPDLCELNAILMKLAIEAHARGQWEGREIEAKKLTDSFKTLIGWLAALGTLAAAAIGLFLGLDGDPQASWRLVGVGFFAGLLGSCITAGRSAAQRHADGYEFEDGFQYPSAEKDTERFNIRMLGFFYLRPFLGAGMGVVAYAGTVAGTLFSTASDGAPRAESVLFFALLAGLFSKTLILKLQKGFDALVG